MSDKIYEPSNPCMQQGARNVLKYLSDITYDKIITGQHTQTMEQEELHLIEEKTGKKPALLGFELLSYSPNINYLDTDRECMDEIVGNNGTLKKAWEWAAEQGLITFTWHWFSPLYGRSKAFYTENTPYDPEKAATEGTPEYAAMISDLDVMAGILRPFCEKEIPILWRPFHESDGTWFWWGAKGAEPVKKLYRIMYERFVGLHHLNNLIWVWNSHVKDFYPGDDIVDVISVDLYTDKHVHTSYAEQYKVLTGITDTKKPVILGEVGVLPDPENVHDEKIGWASFMTWSLDFCKTEEYNTFEYLKKVYNSPNVVTKENLPGLYEAKFN